MTKNNNTLTWRVLQLEKSLDEVDSKVEDILTNHLPHLTRKVDSLKTRVSVATAINVGAIMVGLLLAKTF